MRVYSNNDPDALTAQESHISHRNMSHHRSTSSSVPTPEYRGSALFQPVVPFPPISVKTSFFEI